MKKELSVPIENKLALKPPSPRILLFPGEKDRHFLSPS